MKGPHYWKIRVWKCLNIYLKNFSCECSEVSISGNNLCSEWLIDRQLQSGKLQNWPIPTKSAAASYMMDNSALQWDDTCQNQPVRSGTLKWEVDKNKS